MTTNDGCRADVRKARAEAAEVEASHVDDDAARVTGMSNAAPEGFVDGSDFIDSLAAPVAVEGVETVEWSQEAHDARLAKYDSTLDRQNVEHVIARIADYPEIVAAAFRFVSPVEPETSEPEGGER